MEKQEKAGAVYHLPGLFEFYEFYKEFLPVYARHREFFYTWASIGSVYGAPSDCLWAGGRIENGTEKAEKVLALLEQYGIQARLTFSNSLLAEEHLSDQRCNQLCELFESRGNSENGVIVSSELLLRHIRKNYPGLCLISSTTKVITDPEKLLAEICREEFRYVVPDFRFNKQFELLSRLSPNEKRKIEFLVNECCDISCRDRKTCYENVSRRVLDENTPEHICRAAQQSPEGYRFSKAMQNPTFIGIDDIQSIYLPAGFSNFKIEGRSLGSAILLEFLFYYLVDPRHHLEVREMIYLKSNLDLF